MIRQAARSSSARLAFDQRFARARAEATATFLTAGSGDRALNRELRGQSNIKSQNASKKTPLNQWRNYAIDMAAP